MFGLFKKKAPETYVIGAPVKGKAIPLTEVNDPTFSEGMLGQGAAVIPEDGRIYAPADGEVSMVFDTLHAVTLTTEKGTEILIHVGLDTVNLKGEGYESHVKAGDKVKKGDLLLTADLEKIKAAGYDIVTPVVVCNTDDYAAVSGKAGNDVQAGDALIEIQFK